MYHELTGVGLAGRAFRFEVSFKVRQGADGAGKLHDNHANQCRQMNNPPFWEIQNEEYRKSQDHKGNPHFPQATPKINARQAPINRMAAKITE
jgi:hypothetical protein